MTVELAIALVAAVTALLGALTAVLVQINLLRRDVNGRVTQLLEAAGVAREKRGELAGRDFMRRLMTGKPDPVEGSSGSGPGKAPS